LKYALEMECKASLYQEAAHLFSSAPDDREERRAFHKANLRTWTREGWRGTRYQAARMACTRSEVFLIDLDKERPAIVISSDSLNAHSLDVSIVPISSAEPKAFWLVRN